jgi:hypothetical protein
MDPIEELVNWATSRGVKLNGIVPQRILGRGTGIIAIRDIEVKATISPNVFCRDVSDSSARPMRLS